MRGLEDRSFQYKILFSIKETYRRTPKYLPMHHIRLILLKTPGFHIYINRALFHAQRNTLQRVKIMEDGFPSAHLKVKLVFFALVLPGRVGF